MEKDSEFKKDYIHEDKDVFKMAGEISKDFLNFYDVTINDKKVKKLEFINKIDNMDYDDIYNN